jgi:hypothetical protein
MNLDNMINNLPEEQKAVMVQWIDDLDMFILTHNYLKEDEEEAKRLMGNAFWQWIEQHKETLFDMDKVEMWDIGMCMAILTKMGGPSMPAGTLGLVVDTITELRAQGVL